MVNVPTRGDAFNSFNPALWSSMDPKCFTYRDGAFGIERQVSLAFREWVAFLQERDELQYDGGVAWETITAPAAQGTRNEAEDVEASGASLSSPTTVSSSVVGGHPLPSPSRRALCHGGAQRVICRSCGMISGVVARTFRKAVM